MGDNRCYNVDLVPKFIMACGEWGIEMEKDRGACAPRQPCLWLITPEFACFCGCMRDSVSVVWMRQRHCPRVFHFSTF